MNKTLIQTALAAGMTMLAGGAIAHDPKQSWARHTGLY